MAALAHVDSAQGPLQTFHLAFSVPNRGTGYVDVKVSRNKDPLTWGFDLVYPHHADPRFAIGFPVCKAWVRCVDHVSYRSNFGWIQVVKSTDGEPSNEWALDPIPIPEGLDTPFAWFGP